jgi:hypothetical protein
METSPLLEVSSIVAILAHSTERMVVLRSGLWSLCSSSEQQLWWFLPPRTFSFKQLVATVQLQTDNNILVYFSRQTDSLKFALTTSAHSWFATPFRPFVVCFTTSAHSLCASPLLARLGGGAGRHPPPPTAARWGRPRGAISVKSTLVRVTVQSVDCMFELSEKTGRSLHPLDHSCNSTSITHTPLASSGHVVLALLSYF